MRDIIVVSKFTIIEMFKKKSFQIILGILLLLVIIGFNIPNIANLIKPNNSINNIDKTDDLEVVLIMDNKNVFDGILDTLNNMELGYNFKITKDVKSDKEILKMIKDSKIIAAVNVIKTDNNIKLDYITESLGLTNFPVVDNLIFTDLYKVVTLKNLGLSDEEIIAVNTPLEFQVVELGDAQSGSILVIAMILCMVLFFTIYFFAYQVSTSITLEKTSKIMDTLITSASPKTIVIGKTLGIGIVGLIELLLVIITAFISYKLFLPKGILVGVIDLSGITITFVLISLLYFILGYALYAFIYALTGSLVSKPEDAQQAGSLISLITVVGFYLAYFPMMNPTSKLNTLAALLPISSPFSVPSRYITGGISLGYVGLSILILVISIAFIAYISIKIYSAAILNYGTKFNFKTLVEMFKQNNN